MSYDFPDDLDWDAYWGRELMAAAAKSFEVIGYLVVLGHVRYAKGFSDGTLLREFCDDYSPEPYFPTADSRPRAERLGWCQPS
jgi:hypothetical protein